MDTSFLGIPQEGFGASRGATGAFGTEFNDARLRDHGTPAAVQVVPAY